MCLSPITIPNVNYHSKVVAGSPLSLKDCSNSKIGVPCGHCSECIHNKQMHIVQRAQMESLNSHVFFLTCTYNPESLPIFETSTGFRFMFADWHDLQNTFKRIRNNNAFTRPFKYLAVSERGSKRGRPHFHALIFLPKYPSDDVHTVFNLESILFKNFLKYYARNVGTRKCPKYVPLLTYKRAFIHGKLHTTYDLHAIQPTLCSSGISDVTFYVTKYMLKDSLSDEKRRSALKMNLSTEEFSTVWNKIRSKVISSKFFGYGFSYSDYMNICDYLRKCVEASSEYPNYINLDNGFQLPLSKYYKSNPFIYSLSDALRFYYASNQDSLDTPYESKDVSETFMKVAFSEHKKHISQVSDSEYEVYVNSFFADVSPSIDDLDSVHLTEYRYSHDYSPNLDFDKNA